MTDYSFRYSNLLRRIEALLGPKRYDVVALNESNRHDKKKLTITIQTADTATIEGGYIYKGDTQGLMQKLNVFKKTINGDTLNLEVATNVETRSFQFTKTNITASDDYPCFTLLTLPKPTQDRYYISDNNEASIYMQDSYATLFFHYSSCIFIDGNISWDKLDATNELPLYICTELEAVRFMRRNIDKFYVTSDTNGKTITWSQMHWGDLNAENDKSFLFERL